MLQPALQSTVGKFDEKIKVGLPSCLFIDDLMKSLSTPYYVGLLPAAALHGAAHQQPMGYTVITQSPAPRSIGKLKIIFFSKHKKKIYGQQNCR
jgi:hypothetical protein